MMRVRAWVRATGKGEGKGERWRGVNGRGDERLRKWGRSRERGDDAGEGMDKAARGRKRRSAGGRGR